MTVAGVSYVFPNVAGIPQRGGLLKRWLLAKGMRCGYVEIPADLVKNQTEIDKTQLDLGRFLTREAIAELYERERNVPEELKYVLHTEPSLVRHDGYGIRYQAPLKWHDKEWRKQLVSMTLFISKFFNKPAAIIEVHPGDRRNSFADLIESMSLFVDNYEEEFKVKPLVLLENRTAQFVSSGRDILHFWEHLSQNYSYLRNSVGIVLDVQQLYTVTKREFLKELEMIPLQALKGFHIHHKHSVPSLSDEIPWKAVFAKIADLRTPVIINPEIHHKNRVEKAIKFCRDMLCA